MTTPVIAIIGAGHMGSCLIGGLINSHHPSEKLWVSDPSPEKIAQIQSQFKVHTTSDNKKAIEAAEVIIFAVKPQALAEIAKALAEPIQLKKPLVISIAAGIRENSIQSWLGSRIAIVRAMPNTPALIGCGATGLYANAYVSHHEREVAESILRAVGIVAWLDQEKLMDVVTALSGSGPAYFFLVMEALQAAAEEQGLDADTARLLTMQTALGAARMAFESGKPIANLREHVTSKGGTTEKAVNVLEENGIRTLFKKALTAAKQRSEELADLLGEKV